MNESSNDVNVSNSQVVVGNLGGSGNTGSAVGNLNVGAVQSADDTTQMIAQLREELEQLRTELMATQGLETQPDDVAELVRVLDEPEVDLVRVENMWARILRRLPEYAASLEAVATIIALLTALTS